MRPALTVPHASLTAADALTDHTDVSLPVVELPDMPAMPEIEGPVAPMFPTLTAPDNFPAQANVDFSELPAAHMPDIFDM